MSSKLSGLLGLHDRQRGDGIFRFAGMSDNVVVVRCACDCATPCPQDRVGSQTACQIPIDRKTVTEALRELDRKRRPADFTLRIFGKTIFEGWT